MAERSNSRRSQAAGRQPARAAAASALIRFYGPLNDFLPAGRRQIAFTHAIDGHPSVKDFVERLGVPHPEIDLILVNGASVGFDEALRDGDRVAVFPRFAQLDVDEVSRVRPRPLERVRFVADVHLGTLARRLRLAGLDTTYRADADDGALAAESAAESRILLTRDVGLLKRSIVAYGCFIRATEPHRQFVEVLQRFGPLALQPFTRCLRCNGVLADVPREAVEDLLPPRTRERYERFIRCSVCGRVYWQGSHLDRLTHALESAIRDAFVASPRVALPRR